MELNSRQRKIKYACLALIILALDLLQNVGGLFPELFGARCFLLIPAVIYISIGEEPFKAAMLGLFAGLLWDLTSLVHMGFNCLFFMLICYLASALTIFVARDTFLTNFILSTAVTFIYCFIYWLFFILIKGVDGGELTIISFYLPSAVYTVIVSLALYALYKPVKMKLNNVKQQSFEG